MRILRWTALALAAGLAGALVPPVRAQDVGTKPATKVKRDKYVLTAEEIAERPDINNAYDAVRLLRPNFLKQTRAKGGMSPEAPTTGGGGSSPFGGSSGGSSGLLPVLYLDDVKQEDVQDMKNVRAADLVEIRYMGGTEASGRYGAGHEGGAILVKTKRVGGP